MSRAQFAEAKRLVCAVAEAGLDSAVVEGPNQELIDAAKKELLTELRRRAGWFKTQSAVEVVYPVDGGFSTKHASGCCPPGCKVDHID